MDTKPPTEIIYPFSHARELHLTIRSVLPSHLSGVLRAEFDADLKQLAKNLGIEALSTTRAIFDLFDDGRGGILHIQDLAAGLTVLCDASMAQFVLCACRLYRGPDGDSGFDDVFGLTLSILKVCAWLQVGKQHRELYTIGVPRVVRVYRTRISWLTPRVPCNTTMPRRYCGDEQVRSLLLPALLTSRRNLDFSPVGSPRLWSRRLALARDATARGLRRCFIGVLPS